MSPQRQMIDCLALPRRTTGAIFSVFVLERFMIGRYRNAEAEKANRARGEREGKTQRRLHPVRIDRRFHAKFGSEATEL